MNEKEMAKYAIAIGAVLLVIGVSMQTVPAVQTMGDVIVDTAAPTIITQIPAGTSTDPTVYPSEISGDNVIIDTAASDPTSGVEALVDNVVNVTTGEGVAIIGATTHYSRVRALLQHYDRDADGTLTKSDTRNASSDFFDDKISKKEYLCVVACVREFGGDIDAESPIGASVASAEVKVQAKDIFSDTDGNGSIDIPTDKFAVRAFAKDEAGMSKTETSFFKGAKGTQPAPVGKWYINGRSWPDVKYIKTNNITFKYVCSKNADQIDAVEVEITGDATKTVPLSYTAEMPPTWKGSTTLSDGHYTFKGILVVNGEEAVSAEMNIPLKAPTHDYGDWLAYGIMGVGLLSLLGGAWKHAVLA